MAQEYTKNIQMQRIYRCIDYKDYKNICTQHTTEAKNRHKKKQHLKNGISKTGQSHAKNQTALLSHTAYKNNCKTGYIFKCKI